MSEHEERLRTWVTSQRELSAAMKTTLTRELDGAIAAARAEGRKEGFEKAREMGAVMAYSRGPMGRHQSEYDRLARDIRAMRDGEGGVTEAEKAEWAEAVDSLRKALVKAERERDEARHLQRDLERIASETMKALGGEKGDSLIGFARVRMGELRRAEADNAEQVEALEKCRVVMEENGWHEFAEGTSERKAYEATLFPPGTSHPGAALLERMRALEAVVAKFREAEWLRGDWQGICPFRRHKDIVCMGTDGRVAPVGTPSLVPHDEHCPYHALSVLEKKS